jgi:hypothetical protein
VIVIELAKWCYYHPEIFGCFGKFESIILRTDIGELLEESFRFPKGQELERKQHQCKWESML